MNFRVGCFIHGVTVSSVGVTAHLSVGVFSPKRVIISPLLLLLLLIPVGLLQSGHSQGNWYQYIEFLDPTALLDPLESILGLKRRNFQIERGWRLLLWNSWLLIQAILDPGGDFGTCRPPQPFQELTTRMIYGSEFWTICWAKPWLQRVGLRGRRHHWPGFRGIRFTAAACMWEGQWETGKITFLAFKEGTAMSGS